jgi:hypothetical protein
LREYKCIKCSEFFSSSELILNPALKLKEGLKGKSSSKEPGMLSHLEKEVKKYNSSQMDALQKCAKMKENSI